MVAAVAATHTQHNFNLTSGLAADIYYVYICTPINDFDLDIDSAAANTPTPLRKLTYTHTGAYTRNKYIHQAIHTHKHTTLVSGKTYTHARR